MEQRVEIEVTQGNLNNNHLYLRRHLDFFPGDAVGAANLADGQGRLLTIHFDGFADPVMTDIAGGNKLFLRDRGSWGGFYARHGLRAGDHVRIQRISDHEYAISPLKIREQADVRERDVPTALPPTSRSVVGRAPMSLAGAEYGRFPEFRDQIAALRLPLSGSEVLRPELLIERDGPLEIYYAPVDWVRPAAKVAIVGITPGKDTMRIALETATAGLRADEPEEVFLDRVKASASFSGMRSQLIAWLDELDLHRHLDLDGSAELWTVRAKRLLHPTSSIRYPVIKRGANYSGSGPTIVQSPLLRRYVRDVLSAELAQANEALIVPLGKRVDEALAWLATQGLVDPARILSGFPHPSGANGHRHRQWRDNSEQLRMQAARWFD